MSAYAAQPLVLNTDGSYHEQDYANYGVAVPFQSQGQWEVQGSDFMRQCYLQDTMCGMYGSAGLLTIMSDRSMQIQHQSGNTVVTEARERIKLKASNVGNTISGSLV